MNETKKIGLFSALINSIRSIGGEDEKSETPIDFDDLKSADFKNAEVKETEKAELGKSLSTVKALTDKFFSVTKKKTSKKVEKDSLEEKYGEAKKGNRIYDQAMKINELEEKRRGNNELEK